MDISTRALLVNTTVRVWTGEKRDTDDRPATAAGSPERLKSLPFIMIIADSDAENVTAATAAGVSGITVKPFTAEMPSHTIEQVLGRA